jgi:hypothetical protein
MSEPIGDEMGTFLNSVWKDGYVYKEKEGKNRSLVEQAVSKGFLKQGVAVGFEFSEEASFELTSVGLMELNVWNKANGESSV